jgi:hypothetical protein
VRSAGIPLVPILDLGANFILVIQLPFSYTAAGMGFIFLVPFPGSFFFAKDTPFALGVSFSVTTDWTWSVMVCFCGHQKAPFVYLFWVRRLDRVRKGLEAKFYSITSVLSKRRTSIIQ